MNYLRESGSMSSLSGGTSLCQFALAETQEMREKAENNDLSNPSRYKRPFSRGSRTQDPREPFQDRVGSEDPDKIWPKRKDCLPTQPATEKYHPVLASRVISKLKHFAP